jgi:hypothetical protein
MSSSSGGSIKNDGTKNEFEWKNDVKNTKTSSPAFFGY